ncbi:nuclear transport factor 2 family protein [Arthrobacter sp. NPDC056493]|uniref:nuclear transport factor 2 family protein n=1 Tax=Arthrobacter sp. NPDC056493 TaxID=3345839 RepID=UPI0036709C53
MAATQPVACTPGWVHATGVINLRPVAPVPSEITAIADRLMVQETASRYCLAYDERRLDVLESLMTETTTFAYRFGEGPVHSQSGRTNVLDWLAQVMQSQPDQRRHIVGSLVVEGLSAGEAKVLAHTAIYGITYSARLVTTGIYVFNMVKQNGRWLINEAIDALDLPF